MLTLVIMFASHSKRLKPVQSTNNTRQHNAPCEHLAVVLFDIIEGRFIFMRSHNAERPV